MDAAIIHYIRLRHGLLIGDKTAEELKIKIGSAYEKNLKTKVSPPIPFVVKTADVENVPTDKLDVKVEVEKEKAGERVAIIRGRDIETGLPKSLRITEVEVREALSPVLTQVIDAVASVLEDAPPELTSDILEHGILLTGGGSLLAGLDHLIVERTHIPVILSEDPLTSVVRGTGKVLEDDSLLQRVKVIGGLK
jgi:rod shape-determining protein MreB